jgi:hypothetical protein
MFMICSMFNEPEPAPTTARHQSALDRLVTLGTDLAELVVEQAKAGTITAAEASKAFDRVSRSVRRSVMLSRKLAEPRRTTGRVAARKQIIRTVEDHIQRHAEDGEADTLHQDLQDRLDTEDFEDEIAERPVEDVITDIIRDFGLAALPGTHPWKRRTQADIAALNARARCPASAGAAILPQHPIPPALPAGPTHRGPSPAAQPSIRR